MHEYQDQAMWFEVWGYDGIQWQFIADFDTRTDAEQYSRREPAALEGYGSARVRRQTGLPS